MYLVVAGLPLCLKQPEGSKSELARYEDQVRRVEAQAAGQTELAGSSLEAQFAELEASSAQTEAEARLAALKARSNRTVCLRFEMLIFKKTTTYHRQCRGLHPPQ